MPKMTIKCKNCGKTFKRYKSQISNINSVFCSRECKDEKQKETLIGKNNPNYKKGKWIEPSYCKCSRLKDPRSLKCSECSRKSFPMDGNPPHSWRLVNLKKIVKESKSFKEVADKIGASRGTAKLLIEEADINISHFCAGKNRARPPEEYLIKGKIRRNGVVKRALIEHDLIEYICGTCGQRPIWNNKELVLELHHINGDPYDNRVENLTFLCPCCHSQTANHKGGNSKNVKKRRRK